MKFSEQWLRTMVDPAIGTDELCERLTMAGLEVERAEPAAPPFSGVVVGRIESIAPHPNADRLRVCRVDIGAVESLPVVCGAPNARVGMSAPCALIGARLPNGQTIERSTMRGVESQGMLCSPAELGIDDDGSGLLELDSSAMPGADLRAALALDDTLITLKVTPNRADCLSILGIARDVAAITAAPLNSPPLFPATVVSSAQRKVIVEDLAACPRFVSRTIEGIDAKAPTPRWMRERLKRSGIRSISAVVDITNYVMLELGQPLHAYDERLLEGDVIVRFARAAERLTLLNEQTLELEPDLLLVADSKKPLGLAGIMGGEFSGIGDTTTTVLLEGAFWNPEVIQGKSRRLGFSSDAAYRFERGVDFDGCARAVERATALLLDCCGGKAGPLTDVRGKLPSRDPVRVRSDRIARLLGVILSNEMIATLFERLGCTFVASGNDFIVTPPSYRFDLAIEEDFIEEIARIHGYDAIPTVATAHRQSMSPDVEARRSVGALKERLVSRGWQEVITFSFVSSSLEAELEPGRDAASAPIAVINPIASHLDVMRTTLAGGLIEVLRTNLARQQDRVFVFESGRCFKRARDGFDQPMRLGGLAYGDAFGEQWGEAKRAVDLFDVKGDLEALFAPQMITTPRHEHPALHPGRSASVTLKDKRIGWIGELHPRLVKHFELPRAPVLFEVDLEPLLAHPMPVVEVTSKLPMVRRDLAFVVDDAIPTRDILAALETGKPAHVRTVAVFDIYRGPGIETGRKSLAILVLMQDTERTLTEAEIEATKAGLLQILVDRFAAKLRT